MKTLIVGDVHGKVHIVEQALAQEHPVIFVGDILDSYDRPLTDHLKCLELIMAAIDSGKARCLWGNHELSYFMPKMRCSGHNPAMQAHINGPLGKEISKRFEYFFYKRVNAEQGLLITHAGLDKELWDEFHLNLDNLPQTLSEWCADGNSPAYWIGECRGGRYHVGGIFWNDFQREHISIPSLIQVVGHTRGNGCRQKGSTTCIDYHNYSDEMFYLDI